MPSAASPGSGLVIWGLFIFWRSYLTPRFMVNRGLTRQSSWTNAENSRMSGLVVGPVVPAPGKDY